MVISHKHRFLFIHNYKVAGNSIRSALTPHAHMSFREAPLQDKIRFLTGQYPRIFSRNFRRHTRGYLLRDMLPSGIFEEYFTFGFARNPWDWQVSLYTYMCRKENHKQHELVRSMRGFDEYIEWRISKDLHLQREFFYDDGGNGDRIVDFIGRFETLSGDFRKAMAHVDLQIELPHVNRTDHKPYVEYYTQTTADMIFDAYRQDCDTFGYGRLLVK